MGYPANKRPSGGGGGAGIAGRYLAAIGASSSTVSSVSQRPASPSPPPTSSSERRVHREPSASTPSSALGNHPQHRPTLLLGRRSAVPLASSSTFKNAISPKSTRTERTYPLDQSAVDDEGSSSWDDDQMISPSNNSALEDERRPPLASSRTPWSQREQQQRHDDEDATGVRITVLDAANRDESDQSSLSVSRILDLDLSSPLSHPSDEPFRHNETPRGTQSIRPTTFASSGDRFEMQQRKSRGVVPQRRQEKEPPAWGSGASFRIFLEARQLFAGCEGGPAPTDGSLDDSGEAGDGIGKRTSDRPGAALHPLAPRHRRAPSDVKSDVTSASTQIATNRAVDVAYRQRRMLAEQQKKEHEVSESSHHPQPLRAIHEQHPSSSAPSTQIPSGPLSSRRHPPRYSFGNYKGLSPAQLEAKSVLSVSSNDESSMSRTQQHFPVRAASLSRPTHNKSSDSIDPPAADRLSQHVHATVASQRPPPTEGREYAHVSACDRSQSSSVGVEIDNKLAHNSHSTKHVKASFQNKSLLKNELPNEAVAEEATTKAVTGRNQGFVQMQTKRFAMYGSRSSATVPPQSTPVNKPGASEESACLSPPQIYRTTDPSNATQHQPHELLSTSPDPIFCTKSESSPSHSAATSSMLSSSVPPLPPAHLSKGSALLYSHVVNEEKEEKQDEYGNYGERESKLSQSAMVPAPHPPAATSPRNESQTSMELRSASFGDTRPAYPHRAASSMYWSKKTQSCTAVTIASTKAPTPQPSRPSSARPMPRHGAQLESPRDGHHALLLPVLSNVCTQDSVHEAHPAPKPRQTPHLNGDIRERIPRSAPTPDSPVEAAPCSSFLEAIARFEKKPRKTTPTHVAGQQILQDHAPFELRVQGHRDDQDEEKAAFGNVVGSQSSNRGDMDSQPITQRRRRGIELVLGRSGRSTLTFEEDDSESKFPNDDDTASVKSLRERFEPPSPPQENERSVRKMRAMFEKPKSQYATRSDAVNGPLKDAISKFDSASSSKASRSRSRRTKPRAESLRSVNNVVEEELVGQSTQHPAMEEDAHSSSPSPATVAESRQAREIVSSSTALNEADELSLLSREYDNLAVADRKILSSKSFQEARETNLPRGFDPSRPRSVDPALSHSRLVPSRSNVSQAAVSAQQRTISNRPEPINLVPTSHEALASRPEGNRRATSQEAPEPNVSSKHLNQSVSGPCIKELAASSFILSMRHQIAGPPNEYGRPESMAARTSTMLTRQVLAGSPATVSENPSIQPLTSHAFTRPIERAGGTLTPASVETRKSVTPDQIPRMTGPNANARPKSPGRLSSSNETPRSSSQRIAAVSFLNDRLDRKTTLERAHAALVKPGSLHFFDEKKENSPRASPDGVVSDGVCVSQSPRSESDALDDNSESGEEGSEFSDGVTLDLSIAEVSNLTTPTALVSRADPCDAGRGPGSSDPGSKSVDLAEAEAKRSEASSSQTSEAAAPLLARALGLHPRSDEFSANSFFAKRALIANHWSKTSSLDVKRAYPDDEKESKDDSFGDSGGWDLTRIETSFPNTEPLPADDSIFDFESDWRPFNADRVPTSVGRYNDTHQLFPPTDQSSAKTPTRSNTSVYASAPPRNSTSMISMVHMPKPVTSPHRVAISHGSRSSHPTSPYSSGSAPTRAVDLDSRSPLREGKASEAPRMFSRTYPETKLSSDDPSFWRRRAGVTLSSIRRRDSLDPQPPVQAIERLPVRFPQSSTNHQHPSRPGAPSFSQFRSSSASPNPPTSSVVTSTTSSRLTELAGNHHHRHAAVMDRIRMLKEARLRRTSGYSPHNAALNGYDLPDPDETDHSTQSSTQFGGSTFLASLDVD